MSINKLKFKDEETLAFIRDYLKEDQTVIDVNKIVERLIDKSKADSFVQKSIALMRQYLVLKQYCETLENEIENKKYVKGDLEGKLNE